MRTDVPGWVGRKRKRSVRLYLSDEEIEQLERLARRNGTDRTGAFRILRALAQQGFADKAIREVNGRCSAIRLKVAMLRNRAVPGSPALLELASVDQAAVEISAMLPPVEPLDRAPLQVFTPSPRR